MLGNPRGSNHTLHRDLIASITTHFEIRCNLHLILIPVTRRTEMGKLTIELEEHEVRELLSSLQEITEQLAEIKDLLKAANGSNTRKQSKSKGN